MSESEFEKNKEDILKNLYLIGESSIDPLFLPENKRPIIMYINDPRLNIFTHDMTKEDKKFENGWFYGVTVNGIDYTYAVANKDIKKGEEIMIYYGTKYHKLMNDMKQYKLL